MSDPEPCKLQHPTSPISTPRPWFRKSALSVPSPWWAESGPLALDDEGILWRVGQLDEHQTLDAVRLGPIASDPEVSDEAEADREWLRREWAAAVPRREVWGEWRAHFAATRGV